MKAITTNKANDFHRGEKRQFPAEGGGVWLQDVCDVLCQDSSDESGEEETAAWAHEKYERLRKRTLAIVRGEFSEKSFEIFRDLAAPGATCASIAEAHGVTPNAVYHVKSRVLMRLKQSCIFA